jgi:surface antigen
MIKQVFVMALALLLSACSGKNSIENGEMIGAVAGGVVGTYVGSKFGGGAGSLLFMVAGAAVGSLAGYAYGGTLIPSDRAKFKDSTKIAMDSIRDGQVFSWTNPDTGVTGTIKPTRTYYVKNGQLCRDFDATIAANRKVGRTKGHACKIAPDAWLVESRI